MLWLEVCYSSNTQQLRSMGVVDALSCDLQPKNCTVQILAWFRKGPASSSYSSRYQVDTIGSSIEYFGVFNCTTGRRKTIANGGKKRLIRTFYTAASWIHLGEVDLILIGWGTSNSHAERGSNGEYWHCLYLVHALIRHHLTLTERKYAFIKNMHLTKRVHILTRIYSSTAYFKGTIKCSFCQSKFLISTLGGSTSCNN